MAESLIVSGSSRKEKYESLIPQIRALVEGETDLMANVANVMSALKYGMDFFWVGIYFARKEELVLGPFQGTVACTRIAKGKGVCGDAFLGKKALIVTDVDQYPGHIACSTQSRSEIVIPGFTKNGEVAFVLDVDSDQLADFTEEDQHYLEQVVRILESFA